jgi:hypothetical protein
VIFLKVAQKKKALYCHGYVTKHLPSHHSARTASAVQIHRACAVYAFNVFYRSALDSDSILGYFRINVPLLQESQCTVRVTSAFK